MSTVGRRKIATQQHLIALFKQLGYDEIVALVIRLTKTRQLKQGMMQVLVTDAIRLPLEKAR